MAYEGTPISIPIRGIERAGADTVAADGSMNEVIGLEYKDGSYVPYAPNDRLCSLPQGTILVKVHHTSTQDNVIVIADEQGENHVYWLSKDTFDTNEESDDWIEIPELKGTREIEFVGNTICSNNLDVFMWSKSKNDYVLFSNSTYGDVSAFTMPDLPLCDLAVDLSEEEDWKEDVAESSGNVIVTGGIYTRWPNREDDEYPDKKKIKNLIGDKFLEAKSNIHSQGRLFGFVKARCAYRLTNGSFAMASAPVLLNATGIQLMDGAYLPYTHHGAQVHSTEYDEFSKLPSGFTTVNSEGRILWQTFNGKGWSDGEPRYYSTEDNVNIIRCKSDQIVPDDRDARIVNSHSLRPVYGTYCDSGEPSGSYTVDDMYFVSAQSNALMYKIRSRIPASYRKFISSLCIFITRDIDPYLDTTDYNNISCIRNRTYLDGSNGYFYSYDFAKKEKDDIIDELRALNEYYLVGEIPFEKIVSMDSYEKLDMKGKLGDNLVVQESLGLSAQLRSTLSSGSISTYNNRLHLFDYTESPFRGYVQQDYAYKDHNFFVTGQYDGKLSNGVIEEVVSITEYESDKMTGRFMRSYKNPQYRTINPIISYPSHNATSITLYIKLAGEVFVRKAEFTLRYDEANNISYFISQDLKPFDLVSESVETAMTIEDVYAEESYDVEYNANGLRVSEAGYPSYFPTKDSYTVGDKKIIGTGVLTMALSQDTYGTNPLLLFCEDGIYSMSVDTSAVSAYFNSTPFSREVCVNRNSICSLDGAVAFASERGLMLATASNIVGMFSERINGVIRHLPQERKDTFGTGLYVYNRMVNDSRITSLDNAISRTDFRDYVRDASTFISYVSKKGKLLVYNKNHEYVYWIDIQSKNITKLPIRIRLDNNNYPEEEYYDESTAYSFGYVSKATDIDCLIQSRPIKITEGFKVSHRDIFSGFFNNNSGAEKWADLVTLGSLDTVHWFPIAAKEKSLSGEGFHELGEVVYGVTAKYLMFIFAGQLSSDSHIDQIEITNSIKYNNKLK